ncbi:MAG: DUF4115 domain-containing protein [Calditrichae bacterium]|nr:DUF4115 domain-containing protein [Calditrichia bacterium]NIW78189.1 DUF4115 domain-containing protein [Calditrichia bacterium]
MKEFYQNLKKKREEKGITLDDIYYKTRLSKNYLEAIEAGEIEKLPHGYDRIYLKRYAKEVGLDVDEVLHDFDLLTGRLTPRPNTEKSKEPSKEKSTEDREDTSKPGDKDFSNKIYRLTQNLNLDRIHKVFWITLAVLTVLAAGYFTYQQYVFEKKNQNVKVKEISISELIEDLQKKDSVLTPQLSDNTILRTKTSPQITVDLRALERTWVREIRDQQDTTEYILPTGLKRSIEAVEKVQFVLGRADGVELWLNGKNIGVMGDSNQVVLRLVLTPDGIAEKRLKTVKNQAVPRDTTNTDSVTIRDENIEATM